MKKLFLLLALVGMVATACEDDGVNEPTNTPTETPDGGNDEKPDDGNDEKPDDGNDETPDGGNDEKPEDNTPEDKTQPIKFIDNTVKTLCVISWDTNGDAELSYEEAADVTDIGTTFERSAIISFTELAYFTGLSYIAKEAFLDCGSLKKIELPHNITSIEDSAFSGCNSLTSVIIPDSVTTIGYCAFNNCTSLTSVTIGSGVTEIGYRAFYNCTGELTLNCNCLGLYGGKFSKLIICNSITSIGDNTFNHCTSLTSVTIGNSVTEIGYRAFYYCDSLTSVTIPDSVTSIGDDAFCACTSLTSVTIPDSVTTIGRGAFMFCDSLTSVFCKAATPPAGGSSMFKSNASGREIYVPTASVEAYKSAAYWSDYKDYIVGYYF